MAHTVKQEWSKPDGYHAWMREQRKARPAGRLDSIIEAELAADDGALLEELEAIEFVVALWAEEDRREEFCFVCGRCTDHIGEHDDLVEIGHATYESDEYGLYVRYTREGLDALYRSGFAYYDNTGLEG